MRACSTRETAALSAGRAVEGERLCGAAHRNGGSSRSSSSSSSSTTLGATPSPLHPEDANIALTLAQELLAAAAASS